MTRLPGYRAKPGTSTESPPERWAFKSGESTIPRQEDEPITDESILGDQQARPASVQAGQTETGSAKPAHQRGTRPAGVNAASGANHMNVTDRPPIGTTVRVQGHCADPNQRETLCGTVTRWVGDHTIEVTGQGWSGLYAHEGVVVLERPR